MGKGGIEIELRKPGAGTIAKLIVPATLYGVTLQRYVSFITEAEKIGGEGVNPVLQMAIAVGEFTGVELETLLEAEIGSNDDATIEALDGTLRTLYGYICKICSEHKPKLVSSFDYDGETFYIPTILSGVFGKERLPPLSVLEAVECYEVARLTDQSIKQQGDENGSFQYSYFLRLAAILCRKDNAEHLPTSEAEREDFLNERMLHFEKMSAGDALNIDFFLSNIVESSGLTNQTVGFLNARNLEVGAAMLKLKGRHTKGQLQTGSARLNG